MWDEPGWWHYPGRGTPRRGLSTAVLEPRSGCGTHGLRTRGRKEIVGSGLSYARHTAPQSARAKVLPNHHRLGADVACKSFASEAAGAAGLAGADGGAAHRRERSPPRQGRWAQGVLWGSWSPSLWTLSTASLEFLRRCHDSSG